MILFHYTNQQGLLGIFESRSLWATKIQFLNDQQEMNHALELADSILDEKITSTSDTSLIFQLNRLKLNIPNIKNSNICACSFTENGDLLSQWRGYSNSAGGYSLGFDFDALVPIFSKVGFRIEKCIYDINEKKAKIRAVIDRVLEEHPHTKEKTPEYPSVTSDAARAFLESLSAISPLIKHEAFSEEQEWRAFTPKGKHHDNFSFRAGTSFIVPYIPVQLNEQFNNALIEMYIGPNPDGKRAAASIANLLWSNGAHPKRREPGGKTIYDAKGIGEVDVKLSKTPFRNW